MHFGILGIKTAQNFLKNKGALFMVKQREYNRVKYWKRMILKSHRLLLNIYKNRRSNNIREQHIFYNLEISLNDFIRKSIFCSVVKKK